MKILSAGDRVKARLCQGVLRIANANREGVIVSVNTANIGTYFPLTYEIQFDDGDSDWAGDQEVDLIDERRDDYFMHDGKKYKLTPLSELTVFDMNGVQYLAQEIK